MVARGTPEAWRCGSRPVLRRRAIRRGTFHNVKDLETAIGTYIDGWNERAHPFTWTKGTDEIIAHAKPSPHHKTTYDTRH